MERGTELAQRLAGARAILRDVYWRDVAELAGVVARDGTDDLGQDQSAAERVAAFCRLADTGLLEIRRDKGTRYAQGLTVSWHDLDGFYDLDVAIGESGRLSSADAMHDVVAFSRNGRREVARTSHLDAQAERGLLLDICEEAGRMAHNPDLPPLGSRVVFSRTYTIETEETEQVIHKGTTGTLVSYGGPPADPEAFVWLDDYDPSENGHEIDLYGTKEIGVLRVI